MIAKYRIFLGLLPLLLFAGCIGTDFLEETVELVDPSVVLTPEVESVEIGQSIAFEATYFDNTGAAQVASFTWSSSDETIATVSSTGDAMGLQTGQARIMATAHGISSEALLTVVADPNQVAQVVVSPAMTTVTEGEQVAFSASVTNGRGEALMDRTVQWRTSDVELATINDQGEAQGLEPGTVQVIATVEGIESAPADLEVLARSKSGAFRKTPGTSYSVAGTAILEQVEGGGLQVRFLDDFSVSNGPDLYVYLSTETKVNATSQSLGKLQAISGTQIYQVPAGVGINDFENVLIHCLPFNVTFGYAPLE